MSCRVLAGLIMTPFILIAGILGLFAWNDLTEKRQAFVVICLVLSALNCIWIALAIRGMKRQ